MDNTPFPIRELKASEFPPLLYEIPDAPKKLYVRGSSPPGDHKLLAVVGSRKYSPYGKEATRSLIEGLTGYPISIVSGLALGIDAIAHDAALAADLHTISVPGSGLDDRVLYPRSNRGLARRILESGGLLLSEFEPAFDATPWSFPARNRIMAGMSHATLIIEARERSGTLITARLAMEYNRELLIVPGSIFSSGSFGPHALMRDGATPVISYRDIIEALSLSPREEALRVAIADTDERTLLTHLDTPRGKDELIRLSGIPAHKANILITTLELKGYIREHQGTLIRTISF